MEEEDSQDELINKNQAHGKRKRPTVWDISDDSDEDHSGEEEEGDSESGEGDDLLDGEEEEDSDDDDDVEEEEEEEEDEDDDGKPAEGAVAGTSADLDGMSSDEDAEKCPICLNSFGSQPVATPETCQHYFCLDCILLWSKNANSCPVDRIVFGSIYLRKCYGGKVQKMIMVEKPVKEGMEEVVNLELEQVTCEVCQGSDREDRLLLCDGCDAGYHMECLSPPMDAVPVEEWFCPECEANNRNSRVPDEEVSDAESLPARARPSMHSPRGSAGPGLTRAIARTQQSERVRANVNRHRITQARTAQLAPTYMMQTTWLDDTINAVVAGLNTAVYIRDLSWRPATGRRPKRRKARKVSSTKGQSGKAGTTGVRRRRRKVRRKSRRKQVTKTPASSRSRIAKSLGIARPKAGSTLPSVCRPSEHTLGNMRADIGAASLSVYGDPADLDGDVDGAEEEDPYTRVTTLLEAKRRGISHSALRSHQPVARPITSGLSRRGGAMPTSSRCVTEATPVPDLLGSILSGQSMLMMDSSAVVINRDGTLKALQPERPSSLVSPGASSSSMPSPSLTSFPFPSLPSPSLPSPSSSSSHSSPCLPSTSQAHPPHSLPAPPSHPPALGHARLPPAAPPHPHRRGPPASSGPRGADGAHPHPRKSVSEAKKAPTKAVWEDVSGLPRIPKIKREGGSSAGRDAGNAGNVQSRTSSNGSSNGRVDGAVVARGGGAGGDGAVAGGGGRRGDSGGVPQRGVHSLAGDKGGRQQGVDQTRGRHQGHSQRQGVHERAGPSSGFSNSFCPSSSSRSLSGQPSAAATSSSSSSSAAPTASESSSSYSSAAVSFRIANSGNSWRSQRLSGAAAAAAAVAARSRDSSGQQDSSGVEDEEERRRRRQQQQQQRRTQVRRDKQKLVASRTPPKQEEEVEDIYDPFNPTMSDSDSSDGEARFQASQRDPPPHRNAAPIKSEASEHRIAELRNAAPVKSEASEHRIAELRNQVSTLRNAVPAKREPSQRDPSPPRNPSMPRNAVPIKSEPSDSRIPTLQDQALRRSVSPPRIAVPAEREAARRDPSSSRSGVPVKREPSERRITETEARTVGEVRGATREDAGSGERLVIKREPEEHGAGAEPPARSGSLGEPETRETQTLWADIKIKLEPGLAGSGGTCAHRPSSSSSSHGRTPAPASRPDKTKEPMEAREQTSRPPANTVASGPPQADPAPSRPSSGKDPHGDGKIKSEPVTAPCSRAEGPSGLTPKGPGAPASPRGRRARSNSSEEGGRSGGRERSSSGQGGRRRGGEKERERRSRRSRSRDRRRPRSSSGSSRSDSSSSRRRKKRRPRSGSRSGSLSSSREPPSAKMDKPGGSRERRAEARADGVPDPTDRSREKEPRKNQRSPPKPKPSSSSSRDREKTGSKDKRRPRSRSRSRERRKGDEASSKSAPKASGSATSASKEARKVKEERKENPPSRPREGKDNKREAKKPSAKKGSQTSDFEFKRESKDPDFDCDSATAAKADKVPRPSKEVKTETPADVSPGPRQTEREQTTVEMCCQTDVKGMLRAEDIKKEPQVRIKEEPCDFWPSEASEAANTVPRAASPPPSPPSPPLSPAPTSSSSTVCPPAVTVVTCPPQSIALPGPAEAAPAMVKQEVVERPCCSSSDEDFNVDSLLDNLGLLGSEGRREQQGASGPLKQQQQEEEVVVVKVEPGLGVKVEPGLGVKVEPGLGVKVESGLGVKVESGLGVKVESGLGVKVESGLGVKVESGLEVKAESGLGVKVKVEPGLEEERGPDEVQGEGRHAPTPAPVAVKSKPQGKRVTWNIEVPEGPQPEKSASKLALYKLKLKQEGARRPANKASGSSRGRASAPGGLVQEDQGDPKEGDLPRNDEYLKKLHMQERAIEEVKLAIKPYYQKRDITKDEYKEIVRKAVQKVTHSKSGAINPVKVANLVKAYVDKYKHVRKHLKAGGEAQNAEDGKDLDSP